MAPDPDTSSGHHGPLAAEAPEPAQSGDATAPLPNATAATPAAAVVLDKLACLEVARKAERDRRREESRAAADPRESVARFLKGFAMRHRAIDEALQRMMPNQDPQQQAPQQPRQQQQTPQQQQPLTCGDGGAPDPTDDADAGDLAPLPVSAATPEQVQASLELLSAEVLSLEQAAASASYYLPPYDQKQCAATVAALRGAIEGARSALAPRRRFAFGSKKVNKVRGEEVSAAAATASSPAVATAPAATAGGHEPGATLPAAAGGVAAAGVAGPSNGAAPAPNAAPASAAGGVGPAASAAPAGGDEAPSVSMVSEQDRALVASGRGLMGLTDMTVVMRADEVSEAGGDGDFVLLGLTRCHVVLLGRLRALRAAGLRSCTVVAGPVTGACFVDDVQGSSLSLATYQVRIHRTHRTDLFLRLRSNPIVEHSSGVRVAPWDAAVAPEPRLQQLLQAHKLGEETGCWQQVDDFGWIKSVQSPNWCIMPVDERPKAPKAVPDGVWEHAPAVAGAGAGSGAAPAVCADSGDVHEI